MFNSAVLLISHDLGIIADFCDRVVVMYAGRIVEDADINAIFRNPQHPYTRGLMQSVPSLSDTRKRLYQIPGSVPQPGTIRAGCPFRPRCELRMDICATQMPPMTRHGGSHTAACWATAGTVPA